MATPELTIPCGTCQAGLLHRTYITYYTWLGDELITVPDFPAWRCDICGRRDYDEDALSHLALLLSPNAGKKPKRRMPARRRSPAHPKAPRAGTTE
jgi:YgiT-type zinc finger domain-containing protein